jgi:hypothetical protein
MHYSFAGCKNFNYHFYDVKKTNKERFGFMKLAVMPPG